MLGTLGNTRKIEVIPSYARKNKSAHGLPRQYLYFTIQTGQNKLSVAIAV